MTICWAHTTQNEDKQDRRTQHIIINVPTVNFPFICSNIPAASAYGVYISQLIRYYRDCCSYHESLDKGLLLTRTSPWLSWPLWNICVRNDHGYVPLVINTSRSFPHSWLITGFVAILTRRVPLVGQEVLTLLEHLSSPRFSVGFALLDV
jgi:hypothetical protein